MCVSADGSRLSLWWASFFCSQLRKLVDIHTLHSKKSGLTVSEGAILSGALNFADKEVSSIMVPLQDVFMVDISQRLDIEVLTHIWESGHSRVPVFENDRSKIVGILLVKDLALLNPEDEIPVRTLLRLYGRELLIIFDNTKLIDVLNSFKQVRRFFLPSKKEHGGAVFCRDS